MTYLNDIKGRDGSLIGSTINDGKTTLSCWHNEDENEVCINIHVEANGQHMTMFKSLSYAQFNDFVTIMRCVNDDIIEMLNEH